MYINISIINQSNPIAASHQNRNRTLRCCCFFFVFVFFLLFCSLFFCCCCCRCQSASRRFRMGFRPPVGPAAVWGRRLSEELHGRSSTPTSRRSPKKKYPPLSLSLFFFLFHPPAEEMDVAAGRSEVELRPPSDSGTAGNLKKKRTRKKKKNRRTTPIEEKKTSFQLGSADSNGTEVQP